MMSYYGIKKGYPRLRKRFGKFAYYIVLMRPFTLLPALLVGFFGTLIPIDAIFFHHIITAIYVGITLALAQAAGQIINQIVDCELDKIIKPYRPIPSGAIGKDEAMGIAWILAIFVVGRAFTISTFFGCMVLLMLFFAVFYSLPPLSPRKFNAIINNMWIAISRGLLPMIAVYSIFGNFNEAIKLSVLPFIWVLAYNPTKDVPDAEADARFGIKTIPVEYGLRGTHINAIIFSIAFYSYALYTSLYQFFFLFPLTGLIIATIKKKIEILENTIAWVTYYLGLGAIYVIAFLN